MRGRVRAAVQGLDDLAQQTDHGVVPATALIQSLRRQPILPRSVSVIECIGAEGVTRADGMTTGQVRV